MILICDSQFERFGFSLMEKLSLKVEDVEEDSKGLSSEELEQALSQLVFCVRDLV